MRVMTPAQSAALASACAASAVASRAQRADRAGRARRLLARGFDPGWVARRVDVSERTIERYAATGDPEMTPRLAPRRGRVQHDLSWQGRAACRDASPDLFCGPDGEQHPAYAARVAKAKAVCGGCPVREQCLEYALAWPQAGVWGGLDDAERQRVRSNRLKRESERRLREQDADKVDAA